MSGFTQMALDTLRRKAGLENPPPFLRLVGQPIFGDEDRSNYVDAAFYKPSALRWADYAMQNLSCLRASDRELLAQIWRAMRLGKRPTDKQQKDYELAEEFQQLEFDKEDAWLTYMEANDAPCGPDDEQPDWHVPPDVPPKSKNELLYAVMAQRSGRSEEAERQNYKRRREVYQRLFGTR